MDFPLTKPTPDGHIEIHLLPLANVTGPMMSVLRYSLDDLEGFRLTSVGISVQLKRAGSPQITYPWCRIDKFASYDNSEQYKIARHEWEHQEHKRHLDTEANPRECHLCLAEVAKDMAAAGLGMVLRLPDEDSNE